MDTYPLEAKLARRYIEGGMVFRGRRGWGGIVVALGAKDKGGLKDGRRSLAFADM